MDTMTSVGKKFANFARGRNTKKKVAEPRDDLDCELSFRKASLGGLSYFASPGTSTVKSSKSNSLGSINSDIAEPAFDQDEIISLTHNVRNFSDALAKLKTVLSATEGVSGDDVRVSAHEKLGEVLFILKAVLQRYPLLHNTDVLTSAAVLITKIKTCQYDDLVNDGVDLTACVDQLALSFSSSVSEYLMGDIDSYPNLAKTKSFDNLAVPMENELTASSESKEGSLSGEEIDQMLLRYESGVDIALQRAKAWSKYTKDIIIYVEKRAHFESEFAKNLQKHCNNIRQSITEDSFLPFQSIYCTVLDQDIDLANKLQATTMMVQSQKFIEPLTSRRNEHEKIRKEVKDVWNRELRRMHEAVANVRKTKSLYINRQQEYEKAKDTAQKAETESLNQSTGGQAAKVEKKKKLVEDVLRKAMDAETSYKGCVAEANHRQQELEKVKGEVLCQLRELIHKSDQILKSVTVSYFQLLHTVTAPAPLQFQALCESSQHYEAGSQFMEYVKRLPIPPPDGSAIYEPFVFEPYNPDSRMHEPRKPSTQSSGSGCSEYSPIPSRIDVDKSNVDSDSDSDESPSASPYPSRKDGLLTSSSFGDLPVSAIGSAPDRLGVVSPDECISFRGVLLSPAARTHRFKKLRSPSKCRECETYVYFQGAECEKCRLSSHKKCLETLHWECGHRAIHRRMTTFGVDFSAHVQETHTDVPYLVQKCTAEIDSRGINIKGIYRISGVKSRVEKLCQNFETDDCNVDLSDQHPNVIANVLKLYLRQLPEPLLTFMLYRELINLAKAEQQGTSCDILEKLTTLVHALPIANFRTCGLLMHHLKRVTDHQESNQMSASNLGIVFGPTLLRPSEGAASFDSLLDTPHQTRVIELLILNVESIFGPEQLFVQKPAVDTTDSAPTDNSPTSPLPSSETPKRLTPGQAEASERPMRDTSSLRISRYVPPEFTENLLDELAKEEPRFLHTPEEAKPLPAMTIEVDLGTQAASDPMVSSVTLQPSVNTKTLSVEDDVLYDLHASDDDLPHAPIDSSTPLHAQDSEQGSENEAAGAASASGEEKNSSPGLRKRLLPSHVRPVSSAANSIFYTKEDDLKRVPSLTQPKPFTPPLQRQMNAKRRHERPPLKKPSSLDLPSTTAFSDGSSTESSPCQLLSSSTSPFYLNPLETDSKAEASSEKDKKTLVPVSESRAPEYV